MRHRKTFREGDKLQLTSVLQSIVTKIINNPEAFEDLGSIDKAALGGYYSMKTESIRKSMRVLRYGLGVFFFLLLSVGYLTLKGVISGQVFALFIGSILGFVGAMTSRLLNS